MTKKKTINYKCITFNSRSLINCKMFRRFVGKDMVAGLLVSYKDIILGTN